jgi:phospholipid-binding lipoprotein MlaA
MLSTLGSGLLLAASSPAALAADVPAVHVAMLSEPAPVSAQPEPAEPTSSGPELSDPLADPADAPPQPPSTDAPAAPAQTESHAPGDPFESFNRGMFKGHEKVDRAVLRPAALGYSHVVPSILRDGIRNILRMLTEPIVFLNDLLQFRPEHAMRTLARVAINATLGWGGLFDVAKRPYFKLPHEANGFADTLGYYGVKQGPYLFLPLVGPTTLRDLVGAVGDGAVLPFAIGKPFNQRVYQLPTTLVGGLQERADAEGDLKTLFSTAVDPYATLRSVYLQDRAGEIAALRHGHSPHAQSPLGQDLTDPLSKPEAAAPKASAAPELSDPLADPATSTASK